MALTFREILSWCEENHKEFWEYMLYDDMHIREVSAEESMHKMDAAFQVMCDTIATYSKDHLSRSGLVGAEGSRLEDYRGLELSKLNALGIKPPMCGDYMGDAMIVALKMAESNACMRRIVAAPTAGACGVVPAVLIPYYERNMGSREEIVKALYVAGAIGQVISERASISGAKGGCQAEIGSAAAMAAGALAYLQGGDAQTICHSVALTIKGILGLVCDPVAGLVEVPCVKRNVMGAVHAISCADMAMAGIRSVIPPDEVIDAMAEVGEKMDPSLKETALGGLAATDTARKLEESLL